MSLQRYHDKRDFETTPEPPGTDASPQGRPIYVIQKHAASRLHWDFRIQLGDVLLSWAVPKGPSYDTAEKRLAVRVEDHPVEYASFEGAIPQGEYGGGTVMLWDRGWWEPFETDAGEQLADGVLKMVLHGQRLQGRWVLVRTHGYGGKTDSWLLIKEHDGGERPHTQFDAIAEWRTSVTTGRTMEQIAAGDAEPSSAPGARRAPMPAQQAVELATLTDNPPTGEQWLHEVKYDGYRMLAFCEKGVVRLVSRNGNDWTSRFEPVAAELREAIGEHDALLDGELVALRPDGTSSFQLLRDAIGGTPDAQLHFYAFDLLHLDGWDLRDVDLAGRKHLLDELLGSEETGRIHATGYILGDGELVYTQACQRSLEGVVSKRIASTYREGRHLDWRKSKCLLRQEFIVVGYTSPGGSRTGFGALLLGVHNGDGLVLAGRVGTGFSEASLADLSSRLSPLTRSTPAVIDPPTGASARDIHWVQPQLVVEVSFAEWTRSGKLRHPSFQGLREDKSPDDVVAERPVPVPAPTHESAAAVMTRARVAGVEITNPDRVLWPEAGVTKLEVAHYYESVAELMLPHVRQRPLSLVRCPSGVDNGCFYQKHVTDFPAPVATVDVYEPGKKQITPYARITGLASLIGLVQMGVTEIHPWGSRADDPDRPDTLIFDLDPDTSLPFSQVAATALLLRSELSRLGLQSWLKGTGGKGLHVVVPLMRTSTWDELRVFSRAFVDSIVALEPTLFTASTRKADRLGRIFIDYLRNARGATAIGAYSTRARTGAPVCVPLSWDEIKDAQVRPEFTVHSLGRRIQADGFVDPWANVRSHRQSITAAALKQLHIL